MNLYTFKDLFYNNVANSLNNILFSVGKNEYESKKFMEYHH